jgi:multidrug resistance efflux pump
LLLIKVGVFKRWMGWMTPSIVAVFLGFLLVFFIPMDFGAPSGTVIVLKNSVQISPNVAGPVTEVTVKSNTLLQKGDVLYQIDPTPFEAAVDSLSAKLSLARVRLEQASTLAATQVGSQFEVQKYEAEARGLAADLVAARWNLEQTTVRAPTLGWVPNVALRPGVRVSPGQATMPFIDESKTAIAVQVKQIHTRHIKAGDDAEVIFRMYPGQTFAATVTKVILANASGQMTPGGTVISIGSIEPAPFIVQLELKDTDAKIPAGAVGTGAIYTDEFTGVSHLFRKLMLQQQNWKNYVGM